MPGDVDLLAVLAERCKTDNPIQLLQELEEAGLSVAVKDQHDPAAQRAAMQEFSATLDPIWESVGATRTRLLTDGWSEEMAEHLAGHMAHIMFGMIERELFGAPQEGDGDGEDA